MQSISIRTPTTSKSRNVFAILCVSIACFTLNRTIDGAPVDAREIVKQSLEEGNRNAVRVREYTSSKRVDEKQFEADGSVKTEVVKAYEYVNLDGLMIRKLISKDGKPLPQAEARKEDERVLRIATSRKHETSEERSKRLAEEDKKRVKQRDFNQEIMDAFEFRLAGEEAIAGRKNWVIEATPKPGFHPKELRAQIFPHVKGKLWIDEQDHLWTKAEANAFDPLSVGFGVIATLEQGAHLYFEQIRQPDGVWLLHGFGIRAAVRVALVKRIGIEQVSTYDNFRKVPAGAEIVDDSAN
jgi:hypothetical protein